MHGIFIPKNVKPTLVSYEECGTHTLQPTQEE